MCPYTTGVLLNMIHVISQVFSILMEKKTQYTVYEAKPATFIKTVKHPAGKWKLGYTLSYGCSVQRPRQERRLLKLYNSTVSINLTVSLRVWIELKQPRCAPGFSLPCWLQPVLFLPRQKWRTMQGSSWRGSMKQLLRKCTSIRSHHGPTTPTLQRRTPTHWWAFISQQ